MLRPCTPLCTMMLKMRPCHARSGQVPRGRTELWRRAWLSSSLSSPRGEPARAVTRARASSVAASSLLRSADGKADARKAPVEVLDGPVSPPRHRVVLAVLGPANSAAPSAIRRPMQDGQNPRPLHENGTRSSSPHWLSRDGVMDPRRDGQTDPRPGRPSGSDSGRPSGSSPGRPSGS
jgi:hypothetical protein